MTDADLVQKKLALIETARSLRAAVGFRNVLVHGYANVVKAIVRDVLENHLEDLTAFVAAVWRRMAS